MLRIQSVEIENIRKIRSLKLDFTERCSIICGTNGIGKTTVIDAISSSFVAAIGYRYIECSSDSGNGRICTQVIENNSPKVYAVIVSKDGVSPDYTRGGFQYNAAETQIIVFRGFREIEYHSLDSISSDPKNAKERSQGTMGKGIELKPIKAWFARRLGLSHHLDSKPHLLRDLEVAKNIFVFLDSRVTYESFDPQSFDILVNTDRGIIPFESLSSGFKAVYLMVLGIIQTIEERNQDQPMEASEFDGLVLIDELDTQLHPKWQQKVFGILKETFPKAQFIVTTHSPFVVQAAEPNEVIALEEDGESGTLRRRPIATGKHGFHGWTIEEILTDVMGLESTTTSELTQAKRDFSNAIDNDDQIAATKAYRVLLELLHPQSDLRELLQAQLASVGGASDVLTEAL